MEHLVVEFDQVKFEDLLSKGQINPRSTRKFRKAHIAKSAIEGYLLSAEAPKAPPIPIPVSFENHVALSSVSANPANLASCDATASKSGGASRDASGDATAKKASGEATTIQPSRAMKPTSGRARSTEEGNQVPDTSLEVDKALRPELNFARVRDS